MEQAKIQNAPFSGAATALITPMRGGDIDTDAFRALVRRQVEAKIDALCVCGTTGEAATLSEDERRTLLSVARKEAGDVPILMGCGSADTAAACRNCRAAAEGGADALLVITPFCNKGTDKGIFAHFKRISEAAGDKPVILYNVPSRTGVDLSVGQYKALAELPNVCAVKEAAANMMKLTRLCGETDLTVYSGNDDMILPVIALGGKGVISVLSNLAPKAVREMTHRALSGDFPAAAHMAHRYARLCRLLFAETNPAPVKYAASLLGYCTPEARLPMGDIGDGLKKELQAELAALELL